MSLHHFFLNDQVIAEGEDDVFALQLSPDDAKHARVLRLEPGEHIIVVDAASDYFECEIVDVQDGLNVRIAQKGCTLTPVPKVVLLAGLSKGDKMDDVIRHATELGVCEFVPLMCERSVVKLDAKKAAVRTKRWRSIAKSAAMQSGQRAIPRVCEPCNVRDAAGALRDATCVLVCWEETREGGIRKALHEALQAVDIQPHDATVIVAVGPEGGFTKPEVDRLLSCNDHAVAVTLGPSILRTETAGIVAPALVLYELGGLQ